MPITPDPTYSRIGLSLHLYLLGFKRLSLTYKSALPYHTQSTYGVSGPTSLSSYTPLPLLSLYSSFTYPLISSTSTRDLRSRVGSYFALFSLYTHFTYISSIPPLHCKGVNLIHPISKIGWVFSLFILPSLSVFFYYYISYLILFLYCTYYTTISSLLPVGCETPYGVCYLIYSIIYFYCFPTFTFSLLYLYYITLFSISIFSFTRRVLHPTGLGTSFFLSLYPLIVYLILSILYQIYPSFLYGTLSSSITRRVFHTLRGFYHLLYLYLYLLYRIPYSLYVLYHIYLCFLFYTHSFSLSYIVYTYYIPPLLPVGLHPTGYLLSLLYPYLFPHHLIFISHLTIYYTFLLTYTFCY